MMVVAWEKKTILALFSLRKTRQREKHIGYYSIKLLKINVMQQSFDYFLLQGKN